MFINQHIMCTIVALIGVIGLVTCANANHSIANNFIGQWYTIATVHPLNDKVPLRCDRRNVTKSLDDHAFNIVDSAIALDGKHSYEGTGQIKDSVLCVKYPEFGADYEEHFSIQSYDNGEVLIYHDKSDPKIMALHSRKPTAPNEVKDAFEKEAAKVHMNVTYIDQNNC